MLDNYSGKGILRTRATSYKCLTARVVQHADTPFGHIATPRAQAGFITREAAATSTPRS